MRRIIKFHFDHYWDQNLCGDGDHMIIAAMLVKREFKDYTAYVWQCGKLDVAPVSQKTWDDNIEYD